MTKIWMYLALALSGGCAWGQVFDHEAAQTAGPAGAKAAERAEANAALEARDYARALKLLTPMAAAEPKNARLLYDLGSSQDALDQASAAEVSYRAAIADDPELLEPRLGLGLLLARNGHLSDARVALAGAVSVTGGDVELRARAYRAMARIDEKAHPDDARDELIEALKLSPETPEDTLLAAELAEAAGGGGGSAEAAYRRVLLAHPDDAEATAGLAHLLLQQKKTAEAEQMLRTALVEHPGDAELRVQMAAVYTAEGKEAQALPLVEGLAKADPRDGNVVRLLAGLYVDTGDWAKAEPLLARLFVQFPSDTGVADDRGRALVHLGRYAEAEQVLTRIVAQPKLFPSPAALGDAAGHLAFAASENNDPAEALQAIAVRATVLPNSPEILFVAAISEDKLHHTKLARQDYQEFLNASKGANPDQEFQARHRLIALDHMK